MSYSIEVDAYVLDESGDDYHYVPVYRGSWFVMGLFRAAQARLRGSGCVRVMWRG
jgi:hypothetical protein